MKEWDESAFAKVFTGYERVVEANQHGSYEGSGQAIATKDGKFYVATYGHCSCNGPEETMSGPYVYDNLVDAFRGVDEIFRDDLLAAFCTDVMGNGKKYRVTKSGDRW